MRKIAYLALFLCLLCSNMAFSIVEIQHPVDYYRINLGQEYSIYGLLNGNNAWTGINTFFNLTIINYTLLNVTGNVTASAFCYLNGTCFDNIYVKNNTDNNYAIITQNISHSATKVFHIGASNNINNTNGLSNLIGSGNNVYTTGIPIFWIFGRTNTINTSTTAAKAYIIGDSNIVRIVNALPQIFAFGHGLTINDNPRGSYIGYNLSGGRHVILGNGDNILDIPEGYTGDNTPANIRFHINMTAYNITAANICYTNGTNCNMTSNSSLYYANTTGIIQNYSKILNASGFIVNQTINAVMNSTRGKNYTIWAANVNATNMRLGDGSSSAPAFGFVSEPNTGFYRRTAYSTTFVIGGTSIFEIAGGIYTPQFKIADPTGWFGIPGSVGGSPDSGFKRNATGAEFMVYNPSTTGRQSLQAYNIDAENDLYVSGGGRIILNTTFGSEGTECTGTPTLSCGDLAEGDCNNLPGYCYWDTDTCYDDVGLIECPSWTETSTCETIGCEITPIYYDTNVTQNLYVMRNATIYGNVRIEGNLSVKRPYMMASDNTTQTIPVASTAYVINFSTIEDSYLINLTGKQNFTFKQTGDYLIEISAIFSTDLPNKHAELWVQKNGINIPRSNTKMELPTSGAEIPLAVPFIIDVNTTDIIRFMMASDDAGTQMVYTTNTSYSPETPSIIVTMTKISEITE